MSQLLQKARTTVAELHRFVTHDIWRIGLPGEKVPSGFVTKQIRVVILLFQSFFRGATMLRATALTFATTLSIVPFLALVFFMFQTFELDKAVYQRLQHGVENTLLSAGELIGRDDEEVREALSPEDASETTPGEPSPDEPESVEQTLIASRPETELDPGALDVEVETPEAAVERVPVEDIPFEEPEMLRTRADVAQADASAGEAVEEDEPAPIGSELKVEGGLSSFERQFADVVLRGVTRAEGEGVDPVRVLLDLANQLADEANRNPGTLLLSGIVLFFTTVLGLLQNIESSFNHIWGVKRTRPLYRMVGDYILVTLFLPFIAAAVLGVHAALASEQVAQELGILSVILRGGQAVIIWLTFTALYIVVPNTHVKPHYALLGGVIAGTAWILLAWVYVKFQVGMTNYTLVYSIFAQFPVLLMWIYLSWVILLFGVVVTYAYQNEKTFAYDRFAEKANFAYREALTVRVMAELARRFQEGEPALEPESAARDLNVPTRLMNDALDVLQEGGFVAACATEPVTYQPARPLDKLTVAQVVNAVREKGRDPSLLRDELAFKEVFIALRPTHEPLASMTFEDLAMNLSRPVRKEGPEPEEPPRTIPFKSVERERS